MRRGAAAWWMPLLLLAAPLLGLAPSHRDLAGFFAPIREHTAAELRAGRAPWLNQANGCGEAWFANPETGVLYPPHWIYLAVPLDWGLTAEIALHLTWLSLGAGLLARRLGADAHGRVVAEATAFVAGPVLAMVGVVNNLDALAWVPWMVLAAVAGGRRALPLLALATAAGWLAGEPQVWALGVALCLLARPGLRAVAGLGLGLGLVAVQLAPFLVWVGEGDRGPAAAAALRGALDPLGWMGTLHPELARGAGGGMVFAESLFVGAPLLLLVVLGLGRRWWILAVAGAMGALATLPTIGGGAVYHLLTLGLVRYPARFALLAVAVLLPLVGPGWVRFAAGEGRRLGAVLALAALVLCALRPTPMGWLAAGVPALVLLAASVGEERRWLPGAAVVAGIGGALLAGWPMLELRPSEVVTSRETAWQEATGGRLYTRPENEEVSRRLAVGGVAARLWPVGYVNLGTGVELLRSHAPVVHQRVVEHLAEIDRGPSARWWLDAAAGRWVLLSGAPEIAGLEVEVRRRGLLLVRNRRSQAIVATAESAPDPLRPRRGLPGMVSLRRSPSAVHAVTRTHREGHLWVSLAPVTGWRWWLDGIQVRLAQGPGILQWTDLPAGVHRLEGRYRPPLLWPAGIASVLAAVAVGLLMVGAVRSDHRRAGPA